ncbi:MAG: hypothetical protein QM658_02670 [Gordonia sp. (in: high G+C Gram-positive bacteria)]
MKWPWRRSGGGSSLRIDDPDVRPMVGSYDDALASSTVLDDAGWTAGADGILRHLLWLPAGQVAEVASLAGLEGYVRSEHVVDDDPAAPDGLRALLLARVQRIDSVEVSRERSRMASLVSRRGGQVGGWAVLGSSDR